MITEAGIKLWSSLFELYDPSKPETAANMIAICAQHIQQAIEEQKEADAQIADDVVAELREAAKAYNNNQVVFSLANRAAWTAEAIANRIRGIKF